MLAEPTIKKIPALTSLRFFAAAAIVYYHCLYYVEVNPNSTWAIGVSFFFVLSGFILTYAYDRSTGNWTMRFYVSRVARIWPIHLVTLAAAFVYIHVVEYPGSLVNPSQFFGNLFLVHAWYPSIASVFSYNAVAWSISVEFAFYLVFPLVLLAKRVAIVYVAALAFAIGCVAIVSQYPLVIPPDFNAPNWQSFVLQHPLARLSELLIGVVAARIHARYPMRLNPSAATVAEISVVALVVLFAASSPLNYNWWPHLPRALTEWLKQSGGMLFFAALVFVFAGSSGIISRALAWRPIMLMGEISFCTYMVHHLVLRYFASAGLPFGQATWWYIVPTIYVVSYLLWWGVERPCRKAIMDAASTQSLTATRKLLTP